MHVDPEVLLALDAGAVVLDADGRVVFADPRAADVLQTTPEGLMGREVGEVLAPLATLARHPLVDRLRAAEGPEGRGWVVRVRDDEAAVAVRERDRLLQLASVSELLPSVLHELKNPLAAVETALEVTVEETLDDDLAERLHAILNEVRRASRSLSGVGVVGSGLRDSAYHAIDLAIEEATTLLGATARAHGVRLSADVASMPLLPLDVATTRAIVFNLVRNAIDASRAGGSVVVRARYLGASLCLEVCDTGSGMSQEVCALSTELFFSTKSTGSGIGLPLCKRAVEVAGGTLDIDSVVGVGTTVRVRVPIDQTHAHQR